MTTKLTRRGLFGLGAGAAAAAATGTKIDFSKRSLFKRRPKVAVRSGLPAPKWRKLNQGVTPIKGRVQRVADVLNEPNEILDDLKWKKG